jgi:hypothetical protein
VRPVISIFSFGFLLALAAAMQAAGMVVYNEEVDLSEGGTTLRPVLLTETHRVRFQPPSGWHMELTSTNQTVMFYEPGLGAGILMRLWTDNETNQLNGSSIGWRERVEARMEQAEVVAEFKIYSANAEGLGIDLEQRLNPVTQARYRIALVPFEAGLVEFELRTSAEQATKYHRIFRHVVGSFSAEPRRRGAPEGNRDSPAGTGIKGGGG